MNVVIIVKCDVNLTASWIVDGKRSESPQGEMGLVSKVEGTAKVKELKSIGERKSRGWNSEKRAWRRQPVLPEREVGGDGLMSVS